MTVCVAGMCMLSDEPTSYAIVVATDQLLTAEGNYDQWTPAQHKYYPLTDRILAAYSGRAGVALEIFREATTRLDYVASPLVVQAAKAVSAVSIAYFQREFQTVHLDTIPATINDLMRVGSTLVPSEGRRLRREYRNSHTGCEFIVAGVDDSAHHLYYVGGRGAVHPFDADSFCAVGVGADAATRHLRRFGYHRTWHVGRALLAVFRAKQEAEITQGVGDKRTGVVVVTASGIRQAGGAAVEHLLRSAASVDAAQAIAFSGEAATADEAARWVAKEPCITPPSRSQFGPGAAPQSPPASTHGP